MGFQWPIIHGESAKRLEEDFGADFQRFWGQGSYINVLLEAGERHRRHNIKCKRGTGDGGQDAPRIPLQMEKEDLKSFKDAPWDTI